MKFSTVINNKTVNYRPFTLREYLGLLESQATNNHELFKNVVRKLLDACTDAIGLNKIESELLLIILIVNSKYQKAPILHQNCECGEVVQGVLNCKHIQITPDTANERKLQYDFGKFKVKLKEPELFDDDDIIKMVVKSFESVHTQNEVIGINDLSDNELTDLYNAITHTDIVKISDLLLEPALKYAVPVKCKCGKLNTIEINGFNDFFKRLS